MKKKATIAVGLIFYLLTLVIVIDPEPFFKFGYVGVFIFNLFGPGTFIIPILAQNMNIFALATAASLGMAINDSVSFVVGRNGDAIIPRNDKTKKIEKTLQKYGSVGLFFWSLIPFPYDLIGLIAGYMEFGYWRFVIPTFLGKWVRFIILGGGAVAIVKIFTRT